ncbi:hypothetical protein I6F09_35375 [Bradyrhizobium sp. IC3195]|uniref:hypothetical protein n=1 Tax=Bradyrhizobium sp. IC3195 TaxID=2793804 RepID=UPI001CD54D24|nr:hypothetical protein [Bradyrhizobium sp. IC3195]MCA1473126.1 hypothetical protein [Bradyrhizobium sp. IC3195]
MGGTDGRVAASTRSGPQNRSDFGFGTAPSAAIPDIIHILDEIPKTISKKPIERACIE